RQRAAPRLDRLRHGESGWILCADNTTGLLVGRGRRGRRERWRPGAGRRDRGTGSGDRPGATPVARRRGPVRDGGRGLPPRRGVTEPGRQREPAAGGPRSAVPIGGLLRVARDPGAAGWHERPRPTRPRRRPNPETAWRGSALAPGAGAMPGAPRRGGPCRL